jgi:transcriptional regulator with XRE-family HTH domain
MSRFALATALELPSVVPLGRIESGKKEPDAKLVERIAQVLQWPVGFFYLDDPPVLTLDMIR